MNHEEILPNREPKHAPAPVDTVRGFLKEFQRIGQKALPDLSLAEFKPFWESVIETARVAMRIEQPPEIKWRLRSRIVRPPSEEEMQTRIRLHAAYSLDLATSIRMPSGDARSVGDILASLMKEAS